MVQELLKRDTRVAPNNKTVYLFSGITVCGDCGRQMSRKVSTVAGKKYVYYMCSANKKDGSCSSHRIKEDELEKAVIIYLNAYIEELSEIKKLLGYVEKLPLQESNIRRLDMRIVQLEEETERYEKLKISVYEDLKENLITKDEYVTLKHEFEMRRRDTLDSIAQINIEIERLVQRNGKHHKWIEAFISKKKVETLTRNVVVELIDHIRVYEDKRLEIAFRYADRYAEALYLINNIDTNRSDKENRILQEVS